MKSSLVILVLLAAFGVYQSAPSFSVNVKLQTDEADAALALLNTTRKVDRVYVRPTPFTGDVQSSGCGTQRKAREPLALWSNDVVLSSPPQK
jgi:hypothetical protein